MRTCRESPEGKGKLLILAVLYPAIAAVWFTKAEEGAATTLAHHEHPHPHPHPHDQYHNAPMPSATHHPFHRILTKQKTNNETLSQVPIGKYASILVPCSSQELLPSPECTTRWRYRCHIRHLTSNFACLQSSCQATATCPSRCAGKVMDLKSLSIPLLMMHSISCIANRAMASVSTHT